MRRHNGDGEQRKSLSRKKERKYFDTVTIIIAMIVTAYIFTSLAFIVVKGVPFLPYAFQNEEVRFAVKLSVTTSLISTAICLVLGLFSAYALMRTNLPLKRFCGMVIELPLSLPNIMLGLSLMLMFASMPGKFLSAHGFPVIFSVNGIVMAHLMINLPFVIRMIKTAFMNVDPRLEWIAGSLGATPVKRFFTVTLPRAKNSIIGAGILAWSRALGEFGATLMLVGATRMKTETLPTSIYLNMATGDTGPAMASALILLLISALSLFLSALLDKKTTVSRADRKK